MSNSTLSSAGLSEELFIRQIRDDLEDPDIFVGTETLTANGSSTVYRCSQFPIYDGDMYGAQSGTVPGTWVITDNNTVQTLVEKTGLSAGANHVNVNYRTGMLIFGAAPVNTHVISVTHSKCRWLDRQISKAINDGLRAMFPKFNQWQSDTSITLATNQWEYTLPPIFADPRVRIVQVEVQDIPATVNRFVPLSGWRRVANNVLQIPGSQLFSPGSVIRVQYNGPYQNVSELDAQVQNIPILYAKGMLLLNKEGPRARADQAAVTQNEGANPPGTQSNAGVAFLRQFETELARVPTPPRHAGFITTYEM